MPYYIEAKYSKPKSAKLGEFITMQTKEEYKGMYVKTYDNKYFSGKSPMDTEEELEKIIDERARTEPESSVNIVLGILAGSLGGFFKKKLTNSEKESGIAKRYFVQDRNNNKIVETDKTTYLQTNKQVVNRNFAEIDWIIKGPADNRIINGYPYEGSESKNRKTIQALESQMKGISTFITDYKYLVEEPVIPAPLTSETVTEKDSVVQLENDRKANFDLKN